MAQNKLLSEHYGDGRFKHRRASVYEDTYHYVVHFYESESMIFTKLVDKTRQSVTIAEDHAEDWALGKIMQLNG